VLSRALIDEKLVADSKEPVTICYFFFNDNEEQSSATTALCALIDQLCSRHHKLYSDVNDKAIRGGKGLRNDFDAIWDLFLEVAEFMGKVICVLDALDACKPVERESLIQSLETFYSCRQAFGQQESNLKFLTTSRPFIENETALFLLVRDIPTIRMTGQDESEKVSSEIDMVMGRELQTIAESFRLDENAHSSLHDRLKRIPNRTHL
jgi:hypothetical protein